MSDESDADQGKNPRRVAGGQKSKRTATYRRVARDIVVFHDAMHPEGISKKDAERDVEDYLERFFGTSRYTSVPEDVIRSARTYVLSHTKEDVRNLPLRDHTPFYFQTEEDIASAIQWADDQEEETTGDRAEPEDTEDGNVVRFIRWSDEE